MTKNLGYYLGLKYPYTVEEEDNGKVNYTLEITDLPGCWAEGKTLKEARKNLEEAKSLWIEEALKRKVEIPEPTKEFSGRMLLRISPLLHGQLNKHARKAGLSLNQFMRNLLEAGLNFSGLIERLDRMERALQAIQEQISSEIRAKKGYTFIRYLPGSSGAFLGTLDENLTGIYNQGVTGTYALGAGIARSVVMSGHIKDTFSSRIALCDPNLEKKKEEEISSL